MGNSLSYVRPWPNVIAGKLEKGCEALDYLGSVEQHLQDFSIEEHTPSGVTFIKHSELKKVVTPRQTRKYKDHHTSAPPSESDSPNSFCDERTNIIKPSTQHICNPDFTLREKLRCGHHQDLLVDVVYSVLPLLEKDGIIPTVQSSRSKICCSVSFSLTDDSSKECPATSRRCRSSSYPLKPIFVESSSQPLSQDCFDSVRGQQIMAVLQNLFDGRERRIMEAVKAARTRTSPTKRLIIEILEARNLRTKTQRDTSNPYCIVRTGKPSFPPSQEASSEVFKTVVAHECLEPCWSASFTLDCAEVLDGKLYFEVWHAPLEKALVDKIAPKVFRKEARNLLGCATVDLQDILSSGIDEWLKLTKTKADDVSSSETFSNKKRGELHVKIRIEMDVSQSYKEWQNFRTLLSAIAKSHVTNNQDGDRDRVPWDGKLTSPENTLIQSYCATFSVSEEATACSWWLVLSSEIMKVDQKYLSGLAFQVQDYLKTNPHGKDKDIEELTNSLINWMNLQITKVKDLQTFYPSWSEIHSKDQLSFSLRTVKYLEENMPPHLLNKTVHPFNLCLAEALRDFLKSWWNTTFCNHQRNLYSTSSQVVDRETPSLNWKEGNAFLSCDDGSPTRDITLSQLRATNYSLYRSFHGSTSRQFNPVKRKRKYSLDGETCETISLYECSHQGQMEEQFIGSWIMVSKEREQKLNQFKNLEIAVQCLTDAYKLLKDVSCVYNDVFYEEFRIPFFRQSFLYLSTELASLIEPLLHQLYANHKPRNLDCKADPLALENGTPTYEIYRYIRQIERLCKEHKFSTEIQLHSGLKDYWKWLSMGVNLWLQRTFFRAKLDIIKEIQLESLSVEEEELYSSSAISTTEIHKMVLTGWQHLCWPTEDNKSEWILKIGEGLSSLSRIYGNEMIRSKLASVRQNAEGNDRNEELKVCIIINNLTFVREALQKLPKLLQETWPNFPCSQNEKEMVLHSIDRSCSELENHAKDVTEETVNKLKPSIVVTLLQSCKLNSVLPLTEHLGREVDSRKIRLLSENYSMFLTYLWRGILDSFEEIIELNKSKQKHSFFLCLSNCAAKCLAFLKQERNIHFEEQEEYKSIQEQLKHLKLSNEALMANFYIERFEEQENVNSTANYSGEIALRASISRSGVLSVNVILAKNLRVMCESGIKHLFSKQDGTVVRKAPPSTYVIIRLVPSKKFAGISAFKSKVQKKSANPVYDVTCEFSLGNVAGNERIEVGFLSASVYSRGCCCRDRFIGEGLLTLAELPRVFSKSSSELFNASSESGKRTQNFPSGRAKEADVPNIFLNLTFPKAAEDYISLRTLQMRTRDKSASRFLKDIKRQ